MPAYIILAVVLWSIYSLLGFVLGLLHSRRGNTNGLCPHFLLLGAFVWADAVVFSLFWLLVTLFVVIVQDWLLFLLVVSVFWVVRSWGEVIYWFNQQFSTLKRNPPEKFKLLFKLFPNDSVWFVYQIFWQCLLVITIIASVKLFSLWL